MTEETVQAATMLINVAPSVLLTKAKSGDCCGGSWIGPPCFGFVVSSLGDHHRGIRDGGCDPNRSQADDGCQRAAHEHIGEGAVLLVVSHDLFFGLILPRWNLDR